VKYTLSSILSKSWDLYIKHFKTIALITIITYLPLNLFLFFFAENTLDSFLTVTRIANIYEFAIGILGIMAISLLVDKGKLNLRKVFDSWPTAIYTQILLAIFIVLLLLALIIPGIIFLVYWFFTINAIILSKKEGKAAMDYSKSLVKGRWWEVLGYLLVIGILPIIVIAAFGLLTLAIPDTSPLMILVSTVSDIIFAYCIVGMTVYYRSLEKNPI